MRRLLATILVVLLVNSAAGVGGVAAQDDPRQVECEFPLSVTDATGESVTIEEEPEEIVTVLPNTAQIVWEIGADEKVTGLPVVPWTDYLEGADDRETVYGEDMMPSVERIVGLEADLVLVAEEGGPDLVESLREANQTVYFYERTDSLERVYEDIETTGQLVGEFEAAANESARMQGIVAEIEAATPEDDRPRVYYDMGGGWTAGAGTLENELIEVAGGENVAATAGIDGYDTISPEIIADQDPEWIVVQEGSDVPANDAVNASTAMEEDQIVEVDSNFISQHGPKTVEPLREIASAIHPEAYEAADLESPDTPTPAQCEGQSTPTPDATPTPQPAGVDDDGAGFTVAGTAAAALAGALLLARRR